MCNLIRSLASSQPEEQQQRVEIETNFGNIFL